MNLSKRISKSILPPLIAVSISVFGFIACDELEPVNPADPAYKLDPPTLQSVEALTDTRMEITWKNNEEHTKEFVVQRKTDTGSYSTIGTVAKNILTFTDTACVLEVEYSYVVQSKVESNVSAYSNTLKNATSFAEPSNLNVEAISDEILRLSWTDNTAYESGFKIERDADGGFVELGTVSSDVTEFTDSGLSFGQNYSYRVAAFTSVNTSSWAIIAAATEFPAPSDLVASSVSDSELLLTWRDNTSYETGFKIERDDGSGFTEIETVSADVIEYTDSGLSFGQNYNYRVAAFSSINTSSWTTITAATEFPAPSNLSASSVSDSELLLSWTDNTGYETGFKIERDAGSGFTEIVTVLSDVTEYTDTGLIYGQSYNYRVAAFTSVNTSSWSIITAATEFPAPLNLSARPISDSEIQLTWTDDCSFESGYRIERGTGSGFLQMAELNANVTSYIDNGLDYGTDYTYRVAGFTPNNISSWTISSFTNTTISAPTNLVATAISDSEIDLSWRDNSSFEAGFRIERDAGIGYELIAEANANITSYTDSGLDYGTKYKYRIAGFTTQNQSDYTNEFEPYFGQSVVDIDGNVYETIQIGDQVWMAENLKVTNYRDGIVISNVTDNSTWMSTLSGAYCYYFNDEGIASNYGALYNWYAVNNSHNIAPEGWHVPTDDEWKELEMYLGLSQSEADAEGFRGSNEGSKLAGNADLWNSGLLESNPEFGVSNFTALPGGQRDHNDGQYYNISNCAWFWSSTEYNSDSSWYRDLYYFYSEIGREIPLSKNYGFSVRCVRD